MVHKRLNIVFAITLLVLFLCVLWLWPTSEVAAQFRDAVESLRASGADIVLEDHKPIALTFFQEAEDRFTHYGKPIGANVWPLIAKLTTLRRLQVRLVPIDDANMRALSGLVNLEYLDISETSMSATACEVLPEFEHLSKLSVAQNPIGDEGIHAIALCKNLVSLDVGATGCTDDGIGVLSDLSNLQWLAIGRPSSTLNKIDQPQITDKGLGKLQLPKLLVLWCQSTGIRGHTLDAVPWRDTLTFLNADFTDFDDEGAKNISKFVRLTGLSILKTNITDAGIASIVELKTLKWLSLAYVMGITDKCIDNLLKLPRPIIICALGSAIYEKDQALSVKGIVLGPPDELYPRQFASDAFTKPSPNN